MTSIAWLVLMCGINVCLLVFFRYQGLLIAIILNLYSIRFVPLDSKACFSTRTNNFVEKITKKPHYLLLVPCFFVITSIVLFKPITEDSFLVQIADLSYFKTTADKVLLALNGYSKEYELIKVALEQEDVFRRFSIEIFAFVFSSLLFFSVAFPVLLLLSIFKYRNNVIPSYRIVIFSGGWIFVSLISLSATLALGISIPRALLITIFCAGFVCMSPVGAKRLVKQSSNFEK